MAIKDSLIQDILKTDKAIKTDRYKRLRNLTSPLSEEQKIVSNALSLREQSVSKPSQNALAQPLAEREQKSTENFAREQSVSATVSTTVRKAFAMREQGVSINNDFTIEELVGIERKLIDFIFVNCQENGALETPVLTTENLRNYLKISAEHLRNIIFRMTKKGVIKVSKLKNGRGGWRIFSITQDLYQKLSLSISVSNALSLREQSVSKPSQNALAQPLANSSSSSSDLNNKETTTTGEEWKTLDIEPLSSIGFTQTHINQIASDGELTPTIVQDSVYAFAFDLEFNNKAKSIKGDPLNYIMGILRNGRPYAAPSNYESPKNRAMRLYIESRQKIENERKKMEEELFKVEFEEWQREQGTETLRDILPPELREKGLLGEKASHWRAHFVQEVWPQKRKELIK